MTQSLVMLRSLAAWLLISVAPAAAAQTPDVTAQTPNAAPQTQGPMQVERVHDGFAIAPDFQLTTVDGTTGWLAGAYGGWVVDNTLLIGAGGYWLTNNSDSRGMQYGGAVVEWMRYADRPIGVSARGLVGFGQARLADTFQSFVHGPDSDARQGLDHFPFGRFGPPNMMPVGPTTSRVIFTSDFFIAQPTVNVLVNFAPRLRLTAGVGYRLIGGVGRYDNRLQGATGSVSLQIGGSSTTQ